MSDFWEFNHECKKMPEGVRFAKIKGSTASQFTVDTYRSGTSLQSTTFYGFRYCPYCGKDMDAK